MASNFFGEIGNFFLKDSGYTKLESGVIRDDLRFASGSIYGARVKLRRSLSGSRFYTLESGSSGDNAAYSKFGGKYYDGGTFVTGTSYPIPQDPRQIRRTPTGIAAKHLQENFTMYSRPSAFGPPVAGRPDGAAAQHANVIRTSPADAVAGFNWAYTPPYYHGEAWADLIFKPDADSAYDLDKILSEIEAVYWRVDSAQNGNTTFQFQ